MHSFILLINFQLTTSPYRIVQFGMVYGGTIVLKLKAYGCLVQFVNAAQMNKKA